MFSIPEPFLNWIIQTIPVPIYLDVPYGEIIAPFLPQTTIEASRYLVCWYMFLIQRALNTLMAKLFPGGFAGLHGRNTADVLASALVSTVRPSLESWSEGMFYQRLDTSISPGNILYQGPELEVIARQLDSYHQYPKWAGLDPRATGTPSGTRTLSQGNNTVYNTSVGPIPAYSTDLPPIRIKYREL